MRKKTVVTVISILLAVIFLAGAVYHFPWPTKIDKTLTMTKLDDEGNELGTFDIHITGTKLNYLFQEERYVLEIDDFDTLRDIKISDTGDLRPGGIISRFGKELGREFLSLSFAGNGAPGDAFDWAIMELTFTEELDCFVLSCRYGGEKWYYVTSTSGDHTTREIIEYFMGLVPGL
ncbi:MAG: hypothetical protein IJN60_05845 [Oscillospiraceae bacterium]|nr:hypothetical protein [Oscillospiraceae bacterium]